MNSVVSTKPMQKPIDVVRQHLNLPAMRAEIQNALPPHVTVDKFLRVAITAIQQNPSLLSADRNSLFASIVTAAQLGLLPDAQLGEAYFVPFKGKVTLIPGYRGLLKLARQGDIGFVEAEIVCANDKTLYVLGDNSHFESVVSWQDRGEMVMVYALAKYRDGGIAARVVMTKAEVDAIRSRSQAANGPAWSNDYPEMAKKTALRRLAKLLPMSTTANNAFRVSELHEEQGRSASVIEGQVVTDEPEVSPADAPATPPRRRKTALDDILRQEGAPSVVGGLTPPDSPEGGFEVDPDTGEIVDRGPAAGTGS